jgi:hypothetical protein
MGAGSAAPGSAGEDSRARHPVRDPRCRCAYRPQPTAGDAPEAGLLFLALVAKGSPKGID